MESGIFTGVHPIDLLTMMIRFIIQLSVIFCLLTLPIIAASIDLMDGDNFPPISSTANKSITTYRLLPKIDSTPLTATENIIISKPTTVFLPPTVESVKIEPNTYAPTELSDEIQAYYSYSMVWYGVFYAFYFVISS